MSMDEYHADPCDSPSVSRSIIKDMLNLSAYHVWYNHPKLNPNYVKEEKEDKFDRGTAAHAILFEGSDNIEIIEAENWRTNAAKEAREKARKIGKIPMLSAQYASAKVMVEQAIIQIADCKDLAGYRLIEDGEAEQSFFNQNEDGLWMRCRPDWVSNDYRLIIDYKTTDLTANPEEYGRIVVAHGLDIQEHLYRKIVFELGQKTKGLTSWPKFVFVVQEVYAPYLCSFISLEPRFQEMGKQKTELGTFMFSVAMHTGKWPAYPDRVCHLTPQPWVISAWEAKAAGLGV